MTIEERKLKDGRPIDEMARLALLKRIEINGVSGTDLTELSTIFSAAKIEVMTALHITETTYRKYKDNNRVEDPALALLITVLVEDPTLWPVRYISEPSIEMIHDSINGGLTDVSMLVGRSRNAVYRWKETPPRDHVMALLDILAQQATLMNDAATTQLGIRKRANYLVLVQQEADRRGVDLNKDQSWK